MKFKLTTKTKSIKYYKIFADKQKDVVKYLGMAANSLMVISTMKSK